MTLDSYVAYGCPNMHQACWVPMLRDNKDLGRRRLGVVGRVNTGGMTPADSTVGGNPVWFSVTSTCRGRPRGEEISTYTACSSDSGFPGEILRRHGRAESPL